MAGEMRVKEPGQKRSEKYLRYMQFLFTYFCTHENKGHKRSTCKYTQQARNSIFHL